MNNLTLSGASRPYRIGCGLIRIGWKWDYQDQRVPSEKQSQAFLLHAANRGVRFFDTAPAYGLSEERLGKFLSEHPELRPGMFIASKCGQTFDFGRMDAAPNDYSPDAVERSLSRSLSLLGKPIDLIQIHSATAQLLENELGSGTGIIEMLNRYRRAGDIKYLGLTFSRWDASKKNILEDALVSGDFWTIQVPYNRDNTGLQWAIEMAAHYRIGVISNRPLASGKLSHTTEDAISFILDNPRINIALVGTANPMHLDAILKTAAE